MQNKPNFRNAQMNVNKVSTKDYENEPLRRRGENKPNSKPIKVNTKPIKANKMPKQTQSKAFYKLYSNKFYFLFILRSLVLRSVLRRVATTENGCTTSSVKSGLTLGFVNCLYPTFAAGAIRESISCKLCDV